MAHVLTPPNPDPFLFDQEDLQGLADDRAIAQGLRFFRDNRVVEIDQSQEGLWALLEDDDHELPVRVRVELDDGGRLALACDCSPAAGAVCHHLVAALLAYADQRASSDQLISAADTAIQDRIRRGRAEVRVEPTSGEPWLGVWRATSVSAFTHFPRHYEVVIRSLRRRANFCNCPDFATNQLGTCKHIEAVLHRISKHPDYDQLRSQAAPFSYVYLAWDVEEAPRLRLVRHAALDQELAGLLDGYFDPAGLFSGRLPEDFFRFAETVAERSDIHVGEDAHARQLAADAAHRLRAGDPLPDHGQPWPAPGREGAALSVPDRGRRLSGRHRPGAVGR
ncbi:MAG: hypothetical protein AB1634_06750 [Thermodesulfobacteriota bacterium]